jgi:hypothetical protein
MTNWIFEYVGKKLHSSFHPDRVDQIIATDRAEAIRILSEMGISWSALYALKPAPPQEEKTILE